MQKPFHRPQLMGILNITPDSFSDGGAHAVPDAALARFVALVEEGADIVDIGAESTRPGAMPLTPDKEWARLQPVLEVVCNHPARKKIRVSIDTFHASTAKHVLGYAVDIINDQDGLRDASMRKVLASSSVQIVVMHALSIPADPKQVLSPDVDVITIMNHWKNEILSLAQNEGIVTDRLIFDPGLGFGKSATQSYALISRAEELLNSQHPWLYGHSKKSFLSLFGAGDAKSESRAATTLAISAQLAAARVPMLRVHDVAAHRAMFDKLQGSV